MSLARSRAVAAHDLRILRRDPMPLVTLLVLPLILMAFVKPAFRDAVVAGGAVGANGAEQAVPGMTVMFSFFLVANVGFAFFREHGWNTWDRLRASHATNAEILLGKASVPLLVSLLQITVLFVVGGLLFDLHVAGSVVGLGLVSVALSLTLVALGLAVTAVCRTVMQLNAIANILALVLAGLGGALTPLSSLPGWARSVAPATPSYWAMRGYRSVILEGGDVGEVLLPVAVLLGFTAALGLVAARRLRFSEVKLSWA